MSDSSPSAGRHLSISEQMLDQFVASNDDELKSNICTYLRQECSEDVDHLPDDILDRMVRGGILRARRNGLTNNVKIMGFVGVMFEICPNFDEHPQIRQMLDGQDGSPESRFDACFSDLPDSVWEEALENYDEDEWFPDVDFSDINSEI